MPKRIQNENDRHREAFAYYRDLGDERTLADVARNFDVTETSVQRWSRSFNWDMRIAEHDAKVGRRAIDLAQQEGVEVDAQAKARNLKMIRMGMFHFAKALAGGDVPMRLADLDRMVKLEQTMIQEAEADQGTGEAEFWESLDLPDMTDKGPDELWRLCVEEVEALRQLPLHNADVKRLEDEGLIPPLLLLPDRLG